MRADLIASGFCFVLAVLLFALERPAKTWGLDKFLAVAKWPPFLIGLALFVKWLLQR